LVNRFILAFALVAIGIATIFAYSNVAVPGTSNSSTVTETSSLSTAISTSPSSSSLTTTATTITVSGYTVGSTAKAECPEGYNSSSIVSQGLVLLTCFNPSLSVGENVTLRGILQNDNSTSEPYVTSANLTITDSDGQKVFQEIIPWSQPLLLAQGQAYECNTVWNTAVEFDGVAPTAGIYRVYLSIGGLSSVAELTLN